MLILIPQPRVTARRLALAIAEHRVERDPAGAGRAREDAPQPKRNPRERVVDAQRDRAARAREPHERAERLPRIGRVMDDARREHDVEALVPEPRTMEIGLYEMD